MRPIQTTVSVLSLSLLLPLFNSVAAQDTVRTSRWALRFTSGAFLPTGASRELLGNGEMSGVQLSRRLTSTVALTGSFGWARSRVQEASTSPKLDVFTSDLGVEYRRPARALIAGATVSPFVGVGGGLRSYNFRSRAVDATDNVAGYIATGGEIGVGRVGVRLEARGYVAGFKPLEGVGRSVMRNDVMLTAALRVDLRRKER